MGGVGRGTYLCGLIPLVAEDDEMPGAGLSISSAQCRPDEGTYHVQAFLCSDIGGARGEGAAVPL